MADIIQIDSRTWSIEDGFVRFFVLEGEEKALVIDSGMTTEGSMALDLARSVLSDSSKPIELINTHSDRDHTAGNTAFPFCYMHEGDEPNYRNMGYKGEIKYVKDGDLIMLGSRDIMVIHIPGHTPGSIALWDLSTRALFAGDSVQDSNIYMFGPTRDINKYIDSLGKLKAQAEDFSVIYGSHGTLEKGVDQIDALLTYAISITLGETTGSLVDLFGNKVLLHSFEKAGFFCELPVSKAVTTDTMRKSDAWTIENLVDSKELMLRAGQSIVDAALEAQGGSIKEPVAVVAGKGNNAGDGYVVASILKDMGIDVDLYLLFPDSFSDNGKFYFDECTEKNIRINSFTDGTSLEQYATIIEGVFGTGFHGEVEGIAKMGIEAINKAGNNGSYIISADINSGINGDTGEGVTYVKSDLTVSIGSFKVGHFKGESLNAYKSIVNKDIGIVIGAFEN